MRVRDFQRQRGRIFNKLSIRWGDPVWNAGKESLSATVSQDDRRQKVFGSQSDMLIMPLFPYMMLTVTMETV